MTMKAAVIGGGAIGGYLATMLHDAGQDVTLCVRTPFERLVVGEPGGETRTVPVTIASRPEEVGAADFIVLATKAQDTESAAPWLERLAGPDTTILVAQNGIEQVTGTQPFANGATIVPAIVYIAAERKAPGHIVHHSNSQLVLPGDATGETAAQCFAGADLTIEMADDFLTIAWRKLLSNIVANPITCLTMRRIDVFSEPNVRSLALGLMREAIAAGRAEGAKLGDEEAERVLRSYEGVNPGSGSSMLYDRLSGRSLEHEHLTGAVVRAAERHGVDVPLNRAIFALVDALDRSAERRS
ncbi:2-dehydropantoate 2-reductase [Aurantimonas sp. VKM B-3413]|uniref:2-dehydropantoate 2-reductase n=1 Tax=Aurantimonas sp. VKM B-3413 TaxID=2779401 RepID=UPI001E3AEB6C|nr:2-dehydropantoate 2-reductase [Aurantimonas sp. VKM B-3413]MCB8838642.1 2-dehydropantoate 2-reductase [Aurantimonas sp. VKM B-3413]